MGHHAALPRTKVCALSQIHRRSCGSHSRMLICQPYHGRFYRVSFVYCHTVLRCLSNRSAMERTLSPLAFAVMVASRSSGVGGVSAGLLGSLGTSKSSLR